MITPKFQAASLVLAQPNPSLNSYTLRPAARADLARLRNLLANGEHVHTQLDWWPLDELVGSWAFVVAARGDAIGALSLAVSDGLPAAWWRALALATDYEAGLLDALLQSTLDGLRRQGARALTCLAISGWLERELPRLGFAPLTQIITLRKDGPRVPVLEKNHIVIRPAAQADAPDVLAVDQAAFDATWRYGARGMTLMWHRMARVIVAEQDGQVIGYASGDLHQSTGHIVRLAVYPTHQGQQVGALLLADMVQSFFAHGAQSVTLNTQIENTTSQKLYRWFGFRPIGSFVDVWQRPLEGAI
jgi:ribosomal-protein-alanine N-acetyltransferase